MRRRRGGWCSKSASAFPACAAGASWKLARGMEQEIDSFIRFLATERGLSDNYQLSTRRSLTEFATWCADARKDHAPGKVTLPMISDYLATQKKRGLAASSIKLAVVALKIFFRFLLAKERIKRDPTETLTLPRIERYLPETLNELQVQQLIESIDTTKPRGLRDRAIIELLYASGLRISELANARLENFSAEQRILRVTGKGNKTRLVPVGRKACEALAAYVSGGAAEAGETADRERDFPFRARDETDDGAALADREGAGAASRVWRRIFIRISCGTVSPRICSGTARICASSRKCSGTRTSRRRRFTRTWISNG